jgi:Rrf2 family protein
MASSSLFAVAVHILALLAMEDRPLTSKHISQSVNTNAVVIRRILGTLNRGGLVSTQLGTDGGSGLARAPEQITLYEVYRAVDQGDLFALHRNPPNPECHCGRSIQPVLLKVFGKTGDAVREALNKVTIADVVGEIESCQVQACELQTDLISDPQQV